MNDNETVYPSSHESGFVMTSCVSSDVSVDVRKRPKKYSENSGSFSSPQFMNISLSPSSYSESNSLEINTFNVLRQTSSQSNSSGNYSSIDRKMFMMLPINESRDNPLSYSSPLESRQKFILEIRELLDVINKVKIITKDNPASFDILDYFDNNLPSSCNTMLIALRYILPRFLLLPIFQFFHIYDIIRKLNSSTTHDYEKLALSELHSSMSYIKKYLDELVTKPSNGSIPPKALLRNFYNTQLYMEACKTVTMGLLDSQLSPEERIDIATIVKLAKVFIEESGQDVSIDLPIESEYITNGIVQVGLKKINIPFTQNQMERTSVSRKRIVTQIIQNSYRHVYLFRKCLIICKRNQNSNFLWSSRLGTTFNNFANMESSREQSPSISIPNNGLKIKKIIPLKRFHVVDEKNGLINPKVNRIILECEDNVSSIPIVINSFFHSESVKDLKTPDATTTSAGFPVKGTAFDGQSIGSNSTILGGKGSIASQMTLIPITHPTIKSLDSNFNYDSLSGISLGSMSSFYSYNKSATSSQLGVKGQQQQQQSLQNERVYLRVAISLPNIEEKSFWLSLFSYLEFKKFILKINESNTSHKIPLVLPNVEDYRFTEPDSNYNIQYDEMIGKSEIGGFSIIPGVNPAITFPEECSAPIKCATVNKMIEKLTHHVYYEKKLAKVFLQNYRRYLQPRDLLELIIERYSVPMPNFDNIQQILDSNKTLNEYYSRQDSLFWQVDTSTRLRERFMTSYQANIQRNCLSFLSKWIRDKVFYKLDFAKDESTRQLLIDFVNSIENSSLNVLKQSIKRYIANHMNEYENSKRPMFQETPLDSLNLDIVNKSTDVTLTNVHPVELAKQITIYEWELYSKIEFWELNGKNQVTGPNLKRISSFSNQIINWFVLSILSADGIEDRCVVMQRLADLMICFEALNNFQGHQEVKSALESASVYRLDDSHVQLVQRSRNHHKEIFTNLYFNEEKLKSSIDQFIIDYKLKLATINPPGVPFVAISDRKRLIRIDNEFPDWIDPIDDDIASEEDKQHKLNQKMINFTKCRQLSDLIDHFLLFQQIPYNIQVDPVIRKFLENLDILKSLDFNSQYDLEDSFQKRSFDIQPHDNEIHLPNSIKEIPIRDRLTPFEHKMAHILSLHCPDINSTRNDKQFKVLTSLISTMSQTEASTKNTLSRFRRISLNLMPNQQLASTIGTIQHPNKFLKTPSLQSKDLEEILDREQAIQLNKTPPPLPPKRRTNQPRYSINEGVYSHQQQKQEENLSFQAKKQYSFDDSGVNDEIQANPPPLPPKNQ